MNERTREKEKAERRALALKKLAKVFGTNGGDGGTNSHTAEKKILNEILRSTTEPSVVGLVRDRLAVLSARDESDESDEDFDITVGVTGAGHERRNPKPTDPVNLKTTFSKQWTSSALRSIAKGSRPVPPTLSSGSFWEELLTTQAPELAHLRATGGSGNIVTEAGENTDSDERRHENQQSTENIKTSSSKQPLWSDLPSAGLHENIKSQGYAVLQRPEAFETDTELLAEDSWTRKLSARDETSQEASEKKEDESDEKNTNISLDSLASAADALKLAGWPPTALFAFDTTWKVMHELFFVAAEALSIKVEDVLLEPTCFAWALESAASEQRRSATFAEKTRLSSIGREELTDAAGSAALHTDFFFGQKKWSKLEQSAVSQMGQNFSTPHRDYSCSEAWSNDKWVRGTTGDVGSPNLVCVWVPLTDATLNSGCLYVVPRESDQLFDDSEHPDHLRPASTETDGGTACRFPIAAARPLPTEAGSVCMWAGQTIHWGGVCRLTDNELDTAEGEDAASDGVVKIRHLMGLDDGKTSAKLRRPRRSLACTFRDGNKVVTGEDNENHKGGALPYMSQTECRNLTIEDRVKLIAQSLVLYSRWFEMPAYLPGLHDDGGFALRKDEKNSKHSTKTSFTA